MENSKSADNSARKVLENKVLCSQMLRDYSGIELLSDVQPEDIEDVTERFLPIFTEERDADVIKKVRIRKTVNKQKDNYKEHDKSAYENKECPENLNETSQELYIIALFEHKSSVDYNVVMQLFRYIVYIWEDYEKEQERFHKGISKSKSFKYPPIIPIVYYEGSEKWTACMQLHERIALAEVFTELLPDFSYKLVALNEYSEGDILSKNNELSLVMLINKMQNAEELKKLQVPEKLLSDISEKSTEDVLQTISQVIASVMRKFNIPEEEIADSTGKVRKRKMGELFENFTGAFDVQAERKKAREAGMAEGRAAGMAEGRAAGEIIHLIKMLHKLLKRNMTVEEIVEMLEDNEELISDLCDIISRHNKENITPEDVENIYNIYIKNREK